MPTLLAGIMCFGCCAGAPAEYAKFEPGDPMPDVTLLDMQGRAVRLRSFVGKKVLICTWASW